MGAVMTRPPFSRPKRRMLGFLLLGVANMNEGQSLVLARLQSQFTGELTTKELAAFKLMIDYNDKAVRVMRVVGNRLEQH